MELQVTIQLEDVRVPADMSPSSDGIYTITMVIGEGLVAHIEDIELFDKY